MSSFNSSHTVFQLHADESRHDQPEGAKMKSEENKVKSLKRDVRGVSSCWDGIRRVGLCLCPWLLWAGTSQHATVNTQLGPDLRFAAMMKH